MATMPEYQGKCQCGGEIWKKWEDHSSFPVIPFMNPNLFIRLGPGDTSVLYCTKCKNPEFKFTKTKKAKRLLAAQARSTKKPRTKWPK